MVLGLYNASGERGEGVMLVDGRSEVRTTHQTWLEGGDCGRVRRLMVLAGFRVFVSCSRCREDTYKVCTA